MYVDSIGDLLLSDVGSGLNLEVLLHSTLSLRESWLVIEHRDVHRLTNAHSASTTDPIGPSESPSLRPSPTAEAGQVLWKIDYPSRPGTGNE